MSGQLPTVVGVTSSVDTQLLDAAGDATLVVNTDPTYDVVLSGTRAFSPGQLVTLTPGKSVVWPEGLPLYAKASGGEPVVTLIPGGDGMTPSASDIAAQLAAGFRVVDLVTLEEAGAVIGDGTAVVRFPPTGRDQMWQVTRAVVACDGAAASKARFYAVPAGGALTQAALRSGTDSGNFDEAEYPGEGLWITPTWQLVAEWIDATPGSDVTVSVQFRLAERSPS